MMPKYVYLIIFVLAAVAIFVLFRILYQRKAYPYTSRHILTRREYKFYQLLKIVAEEYDCIICPKVGLKDLLQVSSNKHYGKYFSKIAAKHVDFVICDHELHVLFAIELDDSSHETPSAIQRDRFKDRAFAAADIPLKRIRDINLNAIRKLFAEEL